MPYKLAINGFGRIGRTLLRAAFDNPAVEVVAINDLTTPEVLAHLLKYDTVYGVWSHDVSVDGSSLVIGKREIPIFEEKDPAALPWKRLGVDVAIESTGHFTDSVGAALHLRAGAKVVLISAPAKDETKVKTGVLGVNELLVTKNDRVFSNASCTTNCIAPVIEILEREFGVVNALMTTVHAYTADQNLQDGPHRDLRRARAAAFNIVPTTTGAAKTAAQVIPSLTGKFDGLAVRVPVPVGSLADVVAQVSKPVEVEAVNDAFRQAAKGRYKGILRVTDDPIVSSDIIGTLESSIVDSALTTVQGPLVKVVAWYDNERGYSQRLLEQAIHLAKQVA